MLSKTDVLQHSGNLQSNLAGRQSNYLKVCNCSKCCGENAHGDIRVLIMPVKNHHTTRYYGTIRNI